MRAFLPLTQMNTAYSPQEGKCLGIWTGGEPISGFAKQ